MTTSERQLEEELIAKLSELKYTHRDDIRDRAALEANFREKFQQLNRVKLTNDEFHRLLEEIVTPDVFTAAQTLRSRNSFTREDGTPLNYTLVNIDEWCKNTFEVVNQLRINTDYSHHRFDAVLLINGVPVVQIELKTLGINPRRAIEQIVDYKNDPGNGFTRTLLCFMQVFVVSNRDSTYYFRIDTTEWEVSFSREVERAGTRTVVEDIKVSRGEEHVFIWCFFLAILQLVLDGAEAYKWAKYVYIDDPISSLDDNNAVMVAHHLAQMLTGSPERVRTVISTHHVLFFNVLCNELKKSRKYFLTRGAPSGGYLVSETDSTPFLYHLASLVELHQAERSGALYTHHFNMMRRVMEQTACFFGYAKWDECIKPEADDPNQTLYKRVIDLMSHGDYSLYEPREMMPENKEHFGRALRQFISAHPFSPTLFVGTAEQTS